MASKIVPYSKLYGVSDTHNLHESLVIPKCDTLIFAGDSTFSGTWLEFRAVLDWIKLKQEQKVFSETFIIPGNHEKNLESKEGLFQARQYIADHNIVAEILIDESSLTLGGEIIYGYPCMNPSLNKSAYFRGFSNLTKTEYDIKLRQIPIDVTILVCHQPPFGVFDMTEFQNRIGCENLLYTIKHRLPNLKAVFFGHNHNEGKISVLIDKVRYENVAQFRNLDAHY